MINKLGKVTLYVESQETAKAFWCEKMGYVVTFEQPMGPGMTWLEVAPSMESETTFVLYSKSAPLPGGVANHPSVILSTTDIDAAHAKMKDAGVEVEDLMKMPYGSMFGFKDQDGNKFMLREDK